MRKQLFIGVTSWNSALFLDCCLLAIAKTTAHLDTQVVVFDNCSTDDSENIARSHGAQVVSKNLNQPDALNHLLEMSDAEYTLLIHADTILLS